MYVFGSINRKWNPIGYAMIGMWIISFSTFQWLCCYTLLQKEQNQLFLFSYDYLGTFFDKPAWLACLTGEFLTMLFHYPLMGSVIIASILTLIVGVTYLCLRVWLTTIWAISLSLMFSCLVGSFHFNFQYDLSSTLCFVGGILMFLLINSLQSKSWIFILPLGLAGAIATYWMFGYGLWIYLILLILRNWKVGLTALLISILSIPLLKQVYYLPTSELYTYPEMGKPQLPVRAIETGFQVEHAYQQGNWDEIVKIVEGSNLANENLVQHRILLFFYNLVQAQRGVLPDVLLKYYPNELGTFINMTPESPLLLYRNMHELYYTLGDMARAGNAAMMACISAPHNTNARMIQRLAECHIVSGDSAVANKYLKLLSQTGIYADWVKTVVNEKKIKYKFSFLNQSDSVSENTYVMMRQLMDSNPNNEVALDYMLCSDLLAKDIETFKEDYDRYCLNTHRLRQIYQEALCIWLMRYDASETEWDKYRIAPQIRERLSQYLERKDNKGFMDTYWYYYDVLEPQLFH